MPVSPRSGEGNIVFFGVLGRQYPPNTGIYTVLQGAEGYCYRVKSIFIANVSDGGINFRLFLGEGAGGITNALYYDVGVPVDTSLLIEAEILVDAAQALMFRASAGNSATILVTGEKLDIRYLG